MATPQLDPLFDDPLQWPRDIRGHVHLCSKQAIKVDKDVLNYRSLYVLGLHTENVIFLPESMDDPDYPPQDPTKFKNDDATVTTFSPNFPAAELSF